MVQTKSKKVIDSREQKPYRFTNSTRTALTTGDYSILGLEDRITIERKELSDFFNCIGNDRERFEAELKRMSEFELPVVIVEAEFTEVLKPRENGSRLHPNSILGSIASWTAKYGITFFFCGGRELAKRMTQKILEKFHKYENEDI